MIIEKKTSIDNECQYINNSCIQACICEKLNGDIIRKYQNRSLFLWETELYKRFLDYNIFPCISATKDTITYKVKGMVSLRIYLNNLTNKNTTLFLNELFSFIKTFKKVGFVHGNLNIDNIFISQQSKLHFFVIDYTNSYNLKRQSMPSYSRTSFIGEYEDKTLKCNQWLYWDILTVYISIKQYYKEQNKKTRILEYVVETFISRNNLSSLFDYCRLNKFDNFYNKFFK